MPISGEHALRRGMISRKAYNNMTNPTARGSASMGLKGKVARFDGRSKDEAGGATGHVGAVAKNEINARAQQKTVRVAGQTFGVPGHAGKGGYKSAGKPPTRSAINENTGEKFPSGAKVRRGNARYRTRGNSGGSDTNGRASMSNYYGGGNNNRT